MKKLEEYETPETDVSKILIDGHVSLGYLVPSSKVEDLERRLAMCRDALKYYQSNPAGMPGEFGRIADEALKATEPNS